MMKTTLRRLSICLFFTILSLPAISQIRYRASDEGAAPGNSADAYIVHEGNRLVIGNNSIERILEVRPGSASTIRIRNKVSGTGYVVRSDEFALRMVFSGMWPAYSKLQNGENPVLVTSKDFVFQGYESSELKNNGKKLSLRYSFNQDAAAFTVLVNYEIFPGEYCMQKWIEISDSSSGMQFVDAAYLESLTFEKKDFSHGQFGQPVFDDDIFFGVDTRQSKMKSKGER